MDDAKEVVVWGAGEEEGMPWAKEEVERDLISGDLQAIGLKESWYQLAMSRYVGKCGWSDAEKELVKWRKRTLVVPIDTLRTDPLCAVALSK